MTPQEIEHGLALLAKMTPGEWVWIRPPYNAGSGCVRAPGHEAALFYGRSWTSARDNRDDLHGVLWLRNHAAELLDLAAIGMGRTCYDASGEALAAEIAHSDRLAEAIRSLNRFISVEEESVNPVSGIAYPMRVCGITLGDETTLAMMDSRDVLAAHAARRKKANRGA